MRRLRQGDRVELADRTAEVMVEQEVTRIVQAAVQGDLSGRIAETGKWWMDCTEFGGLERFGDGFTQQLTDAMLTMHESEEGKAIVESYGAEQFIEASREDYQQIEEVARELGLINRIAAPEALAAGIDTLPEGIAAAGGDLAKFALQQKLVTALKTREIAQEHQVSLLESPGLARAVYFSTEVDQEIPAGLYVAVAQVLAYVYQLRQFRAGRGRKPKLSDLPIPPDLRRDS